MGKLFQLREWLTLPEAAKHLSIVLSEEVSEADVLRLALDGHLKLSAYFGGYELARCGKLIPIADADFKEVASLDGKGMVRLYGGIVVATNEQESHVIKLETEFYKLEGLYDLPMIGAERNDIEFEYARLTGTFYDTPICFDGAFVEGRDGRICQIQESSDLRKMRRPKAESYRPSPGLPIRTKLVVRTSALRDFEASINTSSPSEHAQVTNNLMTLNQAATKFWANADRDDRGTHPNNSDIVAWLVERGFSQRTAEAGATIIRPLWAPAGRKPEE